jgi:hypothetical protein
MAGEIQLNSVSLATESSSAITLGSAVSLNSAAYASTSDVQGVHTTSTVSSGSASLTINSFVSGSAVNDGDYVVGEGITPGTTVSSGGGTTSITLSANAGATLSSDPVSFYKADKVLSPGLVAGGLCRAWVNFNGVGTLAIRNSFNVSSVTDQDVGDYQINLKTAMPDANYCVCVSASSNSASSPAAYFGSSVSSIQSTGFAYGSWASHPSLSVTASAFRFQLAFPANATLYDHQLICVAIFR